MVSCERMGAKFGNLQYQQTRHGRRNSFSCRWSSVAVELPFVVEVPTQRKVWWRLGEKMRRCQRSDEGRIAAPTVVAVVVLRRYRARMRSDILHALGLSPTEAAAGIEDQLMVDLDALRGRCGPEWRQPARLPCLHLSSVQLHNCQHVLSCYTNDVSLRELW